MALQNIRVLATSLGFACCLVGASARAHISIEQAGIHKSRDGDDNLKFAPCGKLGSTRGANIYTYAPGEKITISFKEFIPHPGYYRIAFDADGDDDFKDPASIKPIDPARLCPFNADDKCGNSDFYNSPAVLPGMDNLEPHLAGQSKGTYSFEVTLPNVRCDNCTLQIVQVMEDTIHGAYNPDPNDPSLADIYHQCIDLVLKGDLKPASGSGDAAADDGGCSVARPTPGSSAGALLLLGALAAFLGRRRRLART